MSPRSEEIPPATSKPSNPSFANDYENDYNPKGVPKEKPETTESAESAKAKRVSQLSSLGESDFMDADSAGYDDNETDRWSRAKQQ